MIKTVEWTKDGVQMLDQRLLPSEEKYLMLRSYDEVAEAIRKMVIRGAPAIGVAAAMGIALGASQSVGTSVADLDDDLQYICDVMGKTRPTAVNLFWAIERMREAFQRNKHLKDVEEVKKALIAEAHAIFDEDITANRAIGHHAGDEEDRPKGDPAKNQRVFRHAEVRHVGVGWPADYFANVRT